jgi:hypothetical protein
VVLRAVLLTATLVLIAVALGWALSASSGPPGAEVVQTANGGLLKLAEGGVVKYSYVQSGDSGVGLVRQTAAGKELWRATCEPLGVSHSIYRHEVVVQREGDRLRVTSRGSGGTFVEVLELASGKRIERTVAPKLAEGSNSAEPGAAADGDRGESRELPKN